MTDTKAIYKAIPAIMADVGAIEKTRRNQQQGYQFRGIDDVYAALQLLFVKHGVFVVPRVLDASWDERTTKSGAAMLHVKATIQHTFFASDGSSVEAVTIGEAMDSGDKSANKAMSAAMKYALIETLCIPTSEPKDTEDDSPEVMPSQAVPSQAQNRRYMTPEQWGELRRACKANGADMAKLAAHYQVERPNMIPAEHYLDALKLVEKGKFRVEVPA